MPLLLPKATPPNFQFGDSSVIERSHNSEVSHYSIQVDRALDSALLEHNPAISPRKSKDLEHKETAQKPVAINFELRAVFFHKLSKDQSLLFLESSLEQTKSILPKFQLAMPEKAGKFQSEDDRKCEHKHVK
jgi:hypothetical protein